RERAPGGGRRSAADLRRPGDPRRPGSSCRHGRPLRRGRSRRAGGFGGVTGARDRKRAERQKRKRRSAERPAPPAEQRTIVDAGRVNGEPEPSETFRERLAGRSEERTAEAGAKLEPLEPGERPVAVTVGAIVSGILAVIITVSAILAISGVDAGDREIKPFP